MIAVLFFAGILGVALFVLLARYAPPLLRGARRPGQRPLMSLASLRALTMDLLGAQGLRVEKGESDENYLVATKREPLGELRYLVMISAAPTGGMVDQATVVAVAEQVKAERAAGGMLITPGQIETAGLAGLDVPLELVDGPSFRKLIAQYLPQRLGELDRFDGFGKTDFKGEEAIRRSELRDHPIS